MKTTTQLLAAALVAFSITTANAQSINSTDIPRIISYQGQLRSGATVIGDGEHLFTARLYSDASGTNLLWKGDYLRTVAGGVFSLELGSGGQALPEVSAINSNLYLSIEVDRSGEMKPYTQMTASAYALNVANGAITKEKMGTDYVSSIRVDGKKVTQRGGGLNINSGAGISLSFDEERNALVVSNDLTYGLANMNIRPEAVTTVPNGGTGLSTIANHGIMIGQAANNIKATTLSNGQLLIGSTNNDPVAATLSGTNNQVNVSTGNGSITLSTPQSIGTSSSPTFNNMTLGGDLSADGDILAKGNLTTNGNLLVKGNETTNGNLLVKGDATTNGSATINGDQLTKGNLTANGNSLVKGDATTNGSATINGDQLTKGNLTTNNDLLVKGSVTINVDVFGKRDITINRNAVVKGNITANSNLFVSGNATSSLTHASDNDDVMTTKSYVDNQVGASVTAGWRKGGNSNTDETVNFLGTKDLKNLTLKTNNTERMKIMKDGAILFTGAEGDVPASGAGTRMMWVPSLGALRAGVANSDEWDAANIGINSSALGYGPIASGNYSVALGFFTSAYGVSSTALGTGTIAVGDGSTALGSGTTAYGLNSLATGDASVANGYASTAMGSTTIANGLYSMATGFKTTTTDNYSFVAGRSVKVGLESFGFNGSTTGTTIDMSSMNNIAYFGDVDLIIGNDDNVARGIKFCTANGSSIVSSTKSTTIKAGAQTADVTLTLPTEQGAAGSVLTNNGSGALSWNTNPVAAYATVAAGATITIPNSTTVVKITDDTDSTSVNTVTMPSASNGTIIYIYNNDTEATTGDISLPAASMGVYVYVDGWKKAN